jgi:hypothetical protein
MQSKGPVSPRHVPEWDTLATVFFALSGPSGAVSLYFWALLESIRTVLLSQGHSVAQGHSGQPPSGLWPPSTRPSQGQGCL